MPQRKTEWIASTLLNDEYSSDEEMKNYFKKVGRMSDKQAKFYVGQRNKALMNPLKFKLRTQ